MSAMFEALRQKLGRQIQSVRADREDEVYVLLGDRRHPARIAEHLRGEFGARLVTVFAEDRALSRGSFLQLLCFRTEGQRSVPDRAAPVRVRQSRVSLALRRTSRR